MSETLLSKLTTKEVREWSTLIVSLSALALASIPLIDRLIPLPEARLRVPYSGVSFSDKEGSAALTLGVNFYNLGNRSVMVDGVVVYLNPGLFQSVQKDARDCNPPNQNSIVINPPDTTTGATSGWPVGLVPPHDMVGYKLRVPMFPGALDAAKLEGTLCIMTIADSVNGKGSFVAVPVAAINVPRSNPKRPQPFYEAFSHSSEMREMRFVYGGDIYKPTTWTTDMAQGK